MRIASNMEQYLIQELDSIGMKFSGKEELDDRIALYFTHRGIEVNFNVITRDGVIVKIDSLTIDGKQIKLEYDYGENATHQAETQFNISFDLFIKCLNKEIMSLDGIEVKDV